MMPGPNRIDVEIAGKDVNLADLLEQLQRDVEDLKRTVEGFSGKPLDIPTDPADAALKELRAEFRRLEAAFDRAEKALSFARTRNEIEGTTASARRLANAEAVLAARGKDLIDFSKRLPPELAKGAAAMDRIEKQTEQATRAFREFQRVAGSTGKGFGQLVSAVNGLRAGLAGLIAALGIQQLLRLGRALVQIGGDAVETKLSFDRLVPALRAFTGSTELANDVADRLAQTADRLKTPLAGLIDPFNGIVAGGREAGLTISEINDLFEQSLTSARAFGKGAEDVQRLLTGISQVAGKGVASLEEFRQQIGEAIPNAIPALAKGLSEAEGRLVTTAEAIARVSSGTFEADDALRALTRGFELLNSEAAKGQLKTLAGDIGAFQRASEEARRELADGLEPGLRSLLQTVTALIKENPELIRQLGELGSSGLQGIAALVAKLDTLNERLQTTGRQALTLADGLRSLPRGEEIFGELATKLESFGEGFAGIEERAGNFFEAVEKLARKAVLGSEQSAEEILEAFRKNFREAAEAAGAGAQEIEQTSKDLAEAVGKIAEESVEFRKELEKKFAEDVKEFGAVRQEVAEKGARGLVAIEKKAQEDRQRLLNELVESTKRATEERVRLEAEAAEKARAESEKIIETAKRVAQERIKEDEALATRREQIEQEAAEKILAVQEDFLEKIKKPKADRVKLEQELADKIIEIERDKAEKIRDLEEKVAKAAEDAADRRIKAEQRVQEEYDSSIEKLRELVDTLNEAAEGPDQEGGGLSKVADDAERARDGIGEAGDELEDFLVSLEQVNQGAAGIGEPRDALPGLGELGHLAGDSDAAGSLGHLFGEAGGRVDDFAKSLNSALEAAEGLSGGSRAAVLDLVDSYSDLAAEGQATVDDQQRFKDNLLAIFQNFGVALDDPVAAIQERLEELRTSQSDAVTALQEANAKAEAAYHDVADAADDAGTSAQEAGETADVAWDPITRTLTSVEEAAEGAGDAAEELGVKWERIDGVLTATQESLEGTKEAGETAAEGIRAAGEAASEAAVPLGQAADALEPLKGEIVAEGEPEKLRDLGAAAAEALPSIQPLAEPAQILAEAAQALAAALPAISEQLPVISEAAGQLLALLGESEVDFAALADQVDSLAGPLERISASLPVISEAVASLPEPITAVQEAAEPLFAVALEAADDDRFGRIGIGLASIAEPLPAIPEPMERLQAVLETIVSRREEISEALEATAEGLAAVGAEEVLAALAELIEELETALDLIAEIAEKTSDWKETLSAIVEDMPELIQKLQELGDALRQQVVPGMERAAEATRFFKEDLEGLRPIIDDVKAALQELGEVANQVLDGITTKAQGAAAALRDVAAAAREARDAVAEVQMP